ncbi:hypothetical protein ACFSC4_21645 [Deinococcus malanensis]
MLMLRAGRHKFVYVHNHAPLLFDLLEDPHELRDLAGIPENEELCRTLQAELLAELDLEELRTCILDSQQQRLLVVAGSAGTSGWRHQVTRDASRLYRRASS